MCDPFTMMAAATAGSGILKTAGSLYKGFSGSQAAKAAAEVARNNTAILQENAATERLKGDFSLAKGAFDASRLLTHVEHIMGGQRAHFAANNIASDSGSPLMLEAFTAAQGEVDAGLIRAQAELSKADSDTRVASLTGKAASSAFEEVAQLQKSASSLISGYFGAATEALSAVTSWANLPSAPAAAAMPTTSTTTSGTFSGNNPWGIY